MPVLTSQAQRTLVVVMCVVAVLTLLVVSAVTVSTSKHTRDCAPVSEDAWNAWGQCNAPCEPGGYQFRTRAIGTLPADGGAACNVDDLIQSRTCNTNLSCGGNCVPGDPATVQWSPCPACLKPNQPNEQWKIVFPLKNAGIGGEQCNAGDVFFTRECTDAGVPTCQEPVDCTISNVPYDQTSCSQHCGPGVITQYFSVTTAPAFGGQECDWSLLVRQVPCANPFECFTDCDTFAPYTASDLEWMPDTACDAACGVGQQYSSRLPLYAGDPCPLVQSKSCELIPCPPGSCTPPSILEVQAFCYMQCANMGLPQQPLANASGDGTICSISFEMMEAVCGSLDQGGGCAAPQDCSVSAWMTSSAACSQACDEQNGAGGTIIIQRQVVKPASMGGASCANVILSFGVPCNNLNDLTYQSLSCNVDDPLICSYSTVVAASECTPIDCSLSDWVDLAACSIPCGSTNGGYQDQVRTILQFPENGGALCPTDASAYYRQGPCTFCDGTAYDEVMLIEINTASIPPTLLTAPAQNSNGNTPLGCETGWRRGDIDRLVASFGYTYASAVEIEQAWALGLQWSDPSIPLLNLSPASFALYADSGEYGMTAYQSGFYRESVAEAVAAANASFHSTLNANAKSSVTALNSDLNAAYALYTDVNLNPTLTDTNITQSFNDLIDQFSNAQVPVLAACHSLQDMVYDEYGYPDTQNGLTSDILDSVWDDMATCDALVASLQLMQGNANTLLSAFQTARNAYYADSQNSAGTTEEAIVNLGSGMRALIDVRDNIGIGAYTYPTNDVMALMFTATSNALATASTVQSKLQGQTMADMFVMSSMPALSNQTIADMNDFVTELGQFKDHMLNNTCGLINNLNNAGWVYVCSNMYAAVNNSSDLNNFLNIYNFPPANQSFARVDWMNFVNATTAQNNAANDLIATLTPVNQAVGDTRAGANAAIANLPNLLDAAAYAVQSTPLIGGVTSVSMHQPSTGEIIAGSTCVNTAYAWVLGSRPSEEQGTANLSYSVLPFFAPANSVMVNGEEFTVLSNNARSWDAVPQELMFLQSNPPLSFNANVAQVAAIPGNPFRVARLADVNAAAAHNGWSSMFGYNYDDDLTPQVSCVRCTENHCTTGFDIADPAAVNPDYKGVYVVGTRPATADLAAELLTNTAFTMQPFNTSNGEWAEPQYEVFAITLPGQTTWATFDAFISANAATNDTDINLRWASLSDLQTAYSFGAQSALSNGNTVDSSPYQAYFATPSTANPLIPSTNSCASIFQASSAASSAGGSGLTGVVQTQARTNAAWVYGLKPPSTLSHMTATTNNGDLTATALPFFVPMDTTQPPQRWSQWAYQNSTLPQCSSAPSDASWVPSVCPACPWLPWDAFDTLCDGGGIYPQCWSPCSQDNSEGLMTSSRMGLMLGPVPPGADCNPLAPYPNGAYRLQGCNGSPDHGSECGLYNGVMCGGRGSCDFSTGPTGEGMQTCSCYSSFYGGPTCNLVCPLASLSSGLFCDGLGACGAPNFKCSCGAFGGDACETGGACYVFAFQQSSDSTGVLGDGNVNVGGQTIAGGAQRFLGYIPMPAGAEFTHQHCRALAALSATVMSGTVFLQPLTPSSALPGFTPRFDLPDITVSYRGEVQPQAPPASVLVGGGTTPVSGNYVDFLLALQIEIAAAQVPVPPGTPGTLMGAFFPPTDPARTFDPMSVALYPARTPFVWPADNTDVWNADVSAPLPELMFVYSAPQELSLSTASAIQAAAVEELMTTITSDIGIPSARLANITDLQIAYQNGFNQCVLGGGFFSAAENSYNSGMVLNTDAPVVSTEGACMDASGMREYTSGVFANAGAVSNGVFIVGIRPPIWNAQPLAASNLWIAPYTTYSTQGSPFTQGAPNVHSWGFLGGGGLSFPQPLGDIAQATSPLVFGSSFASSLF